MKTANCCFSTGVTVSDNEPTFASDLMIWNGQYYSIGAGHKEFSADKFRDKDYYVLTLAAIAKELRRERITEASVFIAAGLPLTWVSSQKSKFKEYLLQNEETVLRKSSLNRTLVEILLEHFAAQEKTDSEDALIKRIVAAVRKELRQTPAFSLSQLFQSTASVSPSGSEEEEENEAIVADFLENF